MDLLGVAPYIIIPSQIALVAAYFLSRRHPGQSYLPMFTSYVLLVFITGLLYQYYILPHDTHFLFYFISLTVLLLFPADMTRIFWRKALPNIGTEHEPPYAKRFNRFAYKVDTTEPLYLQKYPWIYNLKLEDEKDLRAEISKATRINLSPRRIALMAGQLLWFSFVAMMYTLYNPILLGYGGIPTLFKDPEDLLFVFFVVAAVFPFLPFLLEVLYTINPTCRGVSLYQGATRTFRKYSRYNSFWATLFLILALYFKVVNMMAIKLYISTSITYFVWIIIFFLAINPASVRAALLSYALQRDRVKEEKGGHQSKQAAME